MIFLALLSLCHIHPLCSIVRGLSSLVSGFIILCPSYGLNFVQTLGLHTLGTSLEFRRSRGFFLSMILGLFDSRWILCASDSCCISVSLESETKVFKDSDFVLTW